MKSKKKTENSDLKLPGHAWETSSGKKSLKKNENPCGDKNEDSFNQTGIIWEICFQERMITSTYFEKMNFYPESY